MAYAAALGDVHAEYLDTTRPEGVIGHPIFPVCYEWPLAVELRDLGHIRRASPCAASTPHTISACTGGRGPAIA